MKCKTEIKIINCKDPIKKLLIYNKFLYLRDVKSQNPIREADNGRNKDEKAEERYWSVGNRFTIKNSINQESPFDTILVRLSESDYLVMLRQNSRRTL